MTAWTFYPAFVATVLSVIGLSYLAYREHVPETPRTLSVMAAGRRETLKYFQIVLWICGTLFAVTMYFFIIPKVSYGSLQAAAWSLTYISEMLLAVIPAAGTSFHLHNILSFGMGIGMLGSAVIFTLSFSGIYMQTELLIAGTMSLLGILTFLDKKKYIFYELPFIFLAHISIIVAAVALT